MTAIVSALDLPPAEVRDALNAGPTSVDVFHYAFRNFARGLACSDPAVIPAVDSSGVAMSDHEALAVAVRLPRP